MNSPAGLPDSRATKDPRLILAIGGGGFTTPHGSPELDRFALELVAKPAPRVCFLPTASGDQREQLVRFHERFSQWPCELSTLSLFHLGRDRVDPRDVLLSQDLIYVGGGSMRNMLAIWREHRLDAVLREAWQAGIALAGLSAGAMCWFQGGISLSGGAPQAVSGIGLLPGSLTVHRNSEPRRLPAYLSAISSGQLPGGYAIDDEAALLFAGERLFECVAAQAGRGANTVKSHHGRLIRERVPVRMLAPALEPAGVGPLPEGFPRSDRLAVEELRSLRLMRQGWR